MLNRINILNLYTERKTTIIDIKDVSAIRNCKIEELVLSYQINNRTLKKDYGNLCYSVLKKPNCSKPSIVVESSLQESRCGILKEVLLAYIIKNNNAESIKKMIASFNAIFEYINKHNPTIDLKNKSESHQLYTDYTKYLISRVVSVDKKNSLSSSYASSLQCTLAYIISIALDTDVSSILIRSKTIQQDSVDESQWNHSEYDIESFFLYNISIFLTIKKFLMEGGTFPISFNFKYDEYKMDCNLSYEGVHSVVTSEKTEDWYDKHEGLANKAIAAFLFCFSCVTAANRSSLFSIESDKFETVPSTQGKRTFTRKNRAKGDEVPIEFGVDFLPHFKEYIEFRSWLLTKYSEDFLGTYRNNLFIYIPNSISKRRGYNNITPITVNALNSYKTWFTTNFIDNWIPIRGIRQIISTEFLRTTNSVRLASLKLGNNWRTFVANYGKTTFDDSANEMSDALDNIFGNILNNSYIYKPSEIETVTIPMGNCSNIEKKSINPEIAITPDCRRPESCLFCSNFVLHPDRTDIKKLLSVLDMFKASKKKNNEQGILIQERIIQILGDLQASFPETKELIPLIQDEIDEGEIDEYWAEISMTLKLLEAV